MAPTDERMNSVMLSIIRRRTPSAEVGDFDKPIYDLDMDSLDVVDLSHAPDRVRALRSIVGEPDDAAVWQARIGAIV